MFLFVLIPITAITRYPRYKIPEAPLLISLGTLHVVLLKLHYFYKAIRYPRCMPFLIFNNILSSVMRGPYFYPRQGHPVLRISEARSLAGNDPGFKPRLYSTIASMVSHSYHHMSGRLRSRNARRIWCTKLSSKCVSRFLSIYPECVVSDHTLSGTLVASESN